LILVPALCATAQASPLPRLRHRGRWITDALGRVVIARGTNMVDKRPPYYPGAVGFGDDDAAFLARIGFNAVRVGVIWKAVEARRGVYDDRYLARIAAATEGQYQSS
jgi:endoglycosylceramidase